PLNVRLPDAFVAVLAQQGGGRDPFGGGQGGTGGQGGQQSGGMGGGQQGGQGGGGQGFFNIPAQRVGELHVAGVCLEHGKEEPRAARLLTEAAKTAAAEKQKQSPKSTGQTATLSSR